MSQSRFLSRVSGGGRAWLRGGVRLGASLLAGLALACGGSGGGAPGGAPAGGAPQGVPVTMVALTPVPVEDAGQFVGTVKSRRSTTIQPQAEGFITAILVKSGDRVAAGAPLFEIDARSQQAAVASLESIRAAREADAAYAAQQAERVRRLLEAGAASQQELDQAVAQQKTAEAQLKAATDQVRQQEAELAYYRVVAPAAGVVGDVPVHVGDRVAKTTVLTTIEDNAGLEVYIGVPVQQASRLKIGLPVRVLDDTGATLADERINFIATAVSDDTQTVLVKTPLERGAGRFRPDQTVRTEIVFNTEPGLTVPLTAVTRINGQFFVFVAENAGQGLVAHQRAVDLGNIVGNNYVVRSGLKPDEQLITGGIQKIADGVPVMAMPPQAPAPAGQAAPGARGDGGGGSSQPSSGEGGR